MYPFHLHKTILFIFIAWIILFSQAFAQFSQDSSTQKKRRFIAALPIAFYTPETRLGLGVSGIMMFNFKNDSVNAPRSTISLGIAFTQNKQILFNLPYNLFIKNRSYHLYGEIAFHKFFYNFYGVGNEQANDYVEKYGVKYPRLRISALKKIVPHFYAGLRYAYDNYDTFDLDSTGQLAEGTIPGSQGCVVSGFGLVTMIDTRNNIFYPSKGMWAEFVIFHDNPTFGSTYNYVRLAFDLTKILSKGENIFAFNLYSIYSNSDLPFFQMGNIGGTKKMRGFYEGRYRDNNLIMFQAEYRRHLIWLLGFTLFADVGQVAHRYDEFNVDYWRYTYGAGLRLQVDKRQKINMRFDVAVGNGKVLTYFTVGEAF